MLTASNASSTCERLAKEAAGSRLGIEVALAYGPFRPEARRCGPLLLQLLDRAGRRLIERVQRESAQTIASGLLVRHVSIPLHSGVGLGEELALDQMQAVQANNPASASARFILVAVSPPVLDISPTDTETPLAPRLQPGQDIGNEPVHIEAGKTPPPRQLRSRACHRCRKRPPDPVYLPSVSPTLQASAHAGGARQAVTHPYVSPPRSADSPPLFPLYHSAWSSPGLPSTPARRGVPPGAVA
jgi:hypothetical protein